MENCAYYYIISTIQVEFRGILWVYLHLPGVHRQTSTRQRFGKERGKKHRPRRWVLRCSHLDGFSWHHFVRFGVCFSFFFKFVYPSRSVVFFRFRREAKTRNQVVPNGAVQQNKNAGTINQAQENIADWLTWISGSYWKCADLIMRRGILMLLSTIVEEDKWSVWERMKEVLPEEINYVFVIEWSELPEGQLVWWCHRSWLGIWNQGRR